MLRKSINPALGARKSVTHLVVQGTYVTRFQCTDFIPFFLTNIKKNNKIHLQSLSLKIRAV